MDTHELKNKKQKTDKMRNDFIELILMRFKHTIKLTTSLQKIGKKLLNGIVFT
jgi:hypothetical protein